MNEHEMREKVIKGLKYLHDVRRWSPDESEESITARRNITGDALALLKAQEQMVMTLSGVRNLKESTPVWLEDVDKKDVIGALFMRDYSGTKCVDFAIVHDWEFERVVADYMDYGIRWRCWTYRPDEKRRAETPWHVSAL